MQDGYVNRTVEGEGDLEARERVSTPMGVVRYTEGMCKCESEEK